MSDPSRTSPAKHDDGNDLREMNDALLVSAVRQLELTDEAEKVAADLRNDKRLVQRELVATELLRRLSAETVVEDNIEVIYEQVVDVAAAIMLSEFASLQMLHPERGAGGELRLLAQRGFTPEAVREWEWVGSAHRSTCGEALRTGQRCVVTDIDACEFMAGTADLAACRQTGIRSAQSTPLRARDGSVVGMLSTHWRQPHQPSDGNLRLLDLLARQAADLIERRRTATALRERDAETRRWLELHRIITSSMAEGLYSVDTAGLVTSVNPEAERMLGWTMADLLGRPMHEVAHARHADGSPHPIEACAESRVLRTGETLKAVEDVFVKQDGGSFAVEYSAAPVRGEHGAIIGLVVVFQDISERKRLRAEMVRAVEELAGMNRSKDEFLAMLSHELRNPLAPIRAAVHVLRLHERGGENLVQQQAREIIERQVGNLTKIVSDLLEVSRVVIGRVRLDLQVVDLNEVVGHALETTHALFEQHRHKVTVTACTDGVWVHGDVTRLEEMIVNLLSNAAKYTPDGGEIEVHCERQDGTDRAQVRVRDNGVGIEPELLRNGRIFDLFTQADRSLARSAGGLGIGLSLVHRLATLHGGSVEAKSPPDGADKGSEFFLRFEQVPPPQRPARREPDPPSTDPEGQRVLLVDDNVDLVMMLGSSLRHAGFSVQSAFTGPDGLRVAQQWRPDVVLLDIGLPGFDGYEVARRLRRDPALGRARASMRLVAMTGYGQERDATLAREAGFDAHVTKPVDFADLVKLLAPVPTKRR